LKFQVIFEFYLCVALKIGASVVALIWSL
jgi:hypothetical protein